jgi:branched-chain amino acid transport system permease protein
MLSSLVVVLFDGLAYGILLFLISLGLSVTLGLMNFINLAHGAFAMIGGYIAAVCMNRLGIPFLATLPLAFLGAAATGLVLEATLYRRLYQASHLDQVLFTIGLTFIMVAAATYLFGPSQQPVRLPDFLNGQTKLFGVELGTYRLFLIGCGVLLTVGLGALLTRTLFGARIRAAVYNQRVAGALGIHVDRVFAATFALGSGLAGLGGALGIDVLGLSPTFPLKFLVYFLIVVAVGGAGTITGPLYAALLIGVADVGGKYYFSQVSGFIIYAVMIVILVLRPSGLVHARGRA